MEQRQYTQDFVTEHRHAMLALAPHDTHGHVCTETCRDDMRGHSGSEYECQHQVCKDWRSERTN